MMPSLGNKEEKNRQEKIITPETLWSEIVFGETDVEDEVVDQFPGLAANKVTEEKEPRAEDLIEEILHEEVGKNDFSLRKGIRQTMYPDYAGRRKGKLQKWIILRVASMMRTKDCPKTIIKRLKKRLYHQHLPAPKKLPVNWGPFK